MKKAIFSWARTFFWEKQEKYFQEKENLSWGRRRGSTSPRRTSSEKGYFLDVHFFLQKKLFFHLQQIRKYVAGHGVKNARKTWLQQQQQ